MEILGWAICVFSFFLATLSLLMSEDFWFFLDFPSARSNFSTFVGGHKGTAIAEKKPRVRKIRVRNSGAGNGRANCRNNHVRKIPPFRGGGLGGGECRFYFYGRADFSEIMGIF